MLLLIVMAVVSGVSLSCSNDEYDEPMGLKTMARRKANSGGDQDQLIGDSCTVFIPDELNHSSGCGYKSIKQAFGERYSLDSIKSVMRCFAENVEYYPQDSLSYAINKLTGKTVSVISSPSSNSISKGDIVIVTKETIERYAHVQVTSGHATVVTSITKHQNFTTVGCYDGCSFDVLSISTLLKTSRM